MARPKDLSPALLTLPRWGLRLSERRALLLAGDLLCALLATLAALWLWTLTSGAHFSLAYLADKAIWFIIQVPGWALLSIPLYDLRRAAFWQMTLAGIGSSAGLAALLYLAAYFLAPPLLLPRLAGLYFILGAAGLQWAWRMFYIRVLVSSYFRRRALVVGAGWGGETIIRTLRELHGWQYEIVGLIDDDTGKHGRVIQGVPVLGDHTRLLAEARRREVSDLIFAITGEVQGGMFQALLDCQAHGIAVVRALRLYEEVTGRVPIEHLKIDWLVSSFVERVRLDPAYLLTKRLVDLLSTAAGLALLVALTPVIALAIRLEGPGPIFYRQVRLGLGGQPFKVVKFRTMRPDAEQDGAARWATAQDSRITRVGRFLRRTRLDELPQFVNILKGEMSLIGPRPERPEFTALLEQKLPFYRTRLLVKPGLTGWAQVNYGYGNTVADALVKLQYDLYYIKHQVWWMEIAILIRTVETVLGMKGT
ncbi:MAG: sugar transferase [Anaerolineales bacterium]|nr:sugar transferase [Anaerolineales bacterium]